MRAGFTLLELLISVVILSVGALALAATAGLVATQVGEGARFTSAAHLARSVLDSLLTRPCSSLVAGAATRAEAAADWVVTRDSSTAAIDVTVIIRTRRGPRRYALGALVACR